MNVYEWIKLGLLILLGFLASYNDIRKGLIPNRILIIFVIVGLCLDSAYIICVAQDTLLLTLGNVLTSILVAFLLYWTQSFAGGDLKLVATMSLLYPAGAYLTYGASDITLFIAIVFAVFWGYIYLLLDSLINIGMRKTGFDHKYVFSSFVFYGKTYITVVSYISLFVLISTAVSRSIIRIPATIIWAGCFVIAWLCGQYRVLGQRHLVGIVIAVDFVIGWILMVFPISKNPGSYIFTALLVLCQMAIRTNLYREIPTSEVKKGMILSMASSMPMQASRIQGLPGISTEDLKDRLTTEQAESIKRWGKTQKGLDSLMIVKKIPFAIFISFGFLTYFIIWGVITR